MRSPKKILVTGGAGFMGGTFIKYLLSDIPFDGSVVNLDKLTYAANLENLKEIESDPRYEFVKGDICDAKLVEQLFVKHQFDVLVHFAAETHVDNSIENSKVFLETNVMGTHCLLEVVRKHPECHMLLISTDEVYGDLSDTGVFTEDTPYHPNSPYSSSKASADLLSLAYVRTYGISLSITHASNNYGPWQNREKLIPTMVHACRNNLPLPVYGTGKNVREWLHAKDHAEAVWQVLQKGKSGEIYNIAGGEEKSNLEVVEAIINILGIVDGADTIALKKNITFVPDRLGHDFRYAMSGKKIQTEIGWKPKCTFEKGLRQTIEEMK